MKTDDPKFTAFALDELDPADRAEVEAMLRENPDAAAEVADVRNVATLLHEHLKKEDAQPLAAKQRDAILRRAEREKPLPVNVADGPRWWKSVGFYQAAAACVILGFGGYAFVDSLTMKREKHVTEAQQPRSEGVAVNVPIEPVAESVPAAPPVLASAPAQPIAPTAPTPPMLAKVDAITLPQTASKLNSGDLVGVDNAVADIQSTTATAKAPAPTELSVSASGSSPVGGMASRGRMKGMVGAGENAIPRSLSSAAPKAKMLAGAPMPANPAAPRKDVGRGVGGGITLGVNGVPDADYGDPSFRRRFGPQPDTAANTEEYDFVEDNAFKRVAEEPLSTFSVDVDTASYANVRRMLNNQQRPPRGAVRIEELVNYFDYDYAQPAGDTPFSVNLEAAACPWQPAHRLLRIGIKGRDIARAALPQANLVFLVDVSGSMNSPDKLPLVKECLHVLADQLREQDRVALVVYAGSSGLVLDSTTDKAELRAAINRLESGGSTNGGEGIVLAYKTARRNFLKEGNNRVILCTDGDFNVGVSSDSELVRLVERERKSGVFLSILGYGTGNLKDSKMEKIANKGNGNYSYIDSIAEGKKVLAGQMTGTLVTIAKDVKLQLEFNPAQVGSYRLIGYENRILAKEDFNDDAKDAGEIGAGHTVTALYEIAPPGAAVARPGVDNLRYQQPAAAPAVEKPVAPQAAELLTVKLRYKQPDGDVSKLIEVPFTDEGKKWEQSTRDFRFAAGVAAFGMMLRESPHKGTASWAAVAEMAAEGHAIVAGDNREEDARRAEFLKLVEKARNTLGNEHRR